MVQSVFNARSLNARMVIRGACLATLLPGLLTGCGLSSVTSGLGTSIFGGSSQASAQPSAVTETELLAAAKAGGDQVQGLGAGDTSPGCPRFTVWPRDQHITIYEPGRVGDGLAIVHRGELTKTARECTIEGNHVTVRYGFSGRVLLGPRGKTGPLSLPISVFVADAKREKISTSRLRVDASVAVENPIGYFSGVQTVTFDVPEGSRPGEFEVFVGFERTTPNAG